jgi:mannose-1-phosphate guanylyltransferase/mannose-6-phosphate isomerase
LATGSAEITNGVKLSTLTENQSTYIPLGEVHKLANIINVWLEIIEVHAVGYFCNDDIVRFEYQHGLSHI